MRHPITSDRQAGLSLIELMIAMALGLILMTALGSLFVNTSRSNTELQKSAQQIENGRYAMQILTEDLKHAGFYGHFFALPVLAGAQDPCEENGLVNLYDAMALPVQAFRAPDLATRADISATSCGALLTNANLAPGSDVIVVRRASTEQLAIGGVAISGEVYVQANSSEAEIQFGNGAAITNNRKANGVVAIVLDKNGNAGPIRKYHVHVYFVAPCSRGAGANGICAAGDDSIPTLKRLTLNADSGTREMSIVPLVEGIEFIKAEWGIDDQPIDPDPTTGQIGDGVVDVYVAAPTDVQVANAIAAKLFVLARNTEPSSGHVDTKSYVLDTLGGATLAAPNDAFKRHAFVSEVMLMNVGGRKEIP